jgi:hypothetical protein
MIGIDSEATVFRMIALAMREHAEAERRAHDGLFMFEQMFRALDKGDLYRVARCSQSFLHNLKEAIVCTAAAERWLDKCAMPYHGPKLTTLGTEESPSTLTNAEPASALVVDSGAGTIPPVHTQLLPAGVAAMTRGEWCLVLVNFFMLANLVYVSVMWRKALRGWEKANDMSRELLVELCKLDKAVARLESKQMARVLFGIAKGGDA